jgi:hypothetical protein
VIDVFSQVSAIRRALTGAIGECPLVPLPCRRSVLAALEQLDRLLDAVLSLPSQRHDVCCEVESIVAEDGNDFERLELVTQ